MRDFSTEAKFASNSNRSPLGITPLFTNSFALTTSSLDICNCNF